MSRNFARLLQAAGLDHVDSLFDDAHDSRWADKGTEVRGRLRTFEMPLTLYDKQIAEEALYSTLSKGIDRVSFATVYELVAFAGNGWNGRDTVMAIGSLYNFTGVAAKLVRYRGKRLLETAPKARERSPYWRNENHHLLYVVL